MKFSIFYPIKPQRINQTFGVNGGYYKSHGINIDGHNGLDIQAQHSQPVYATHDGICFPEIDNKQGNGVVIRTEEVFDYNDQQVHFKTIYWHLTKADAVVKTGQKVKAGDLIGYADNTGLSTGDHLHFGLKPQAWNENDWIWYNVEQNNGYLGAIDPLPYFNGYYAEDAQKVFTILQRIIDTLKQILKIKLGN